MAKEDDKNRSDNQTAPDEPVNSTVPVDPPGAVNDETSRSRARLFTNMIEVQFQKGTRLEVDDAPDGAMCAFRSAGDSFSVDALNAFIREQGCTKAERVFDESPEDMADAEELARIQDVEAPDLSGFYVLHFPADKDVHAIARRLPDYPGVKYAAALPLTRFACGRDTQMPTDELLFPNGKRDDHQWYIERCKIDKAWTLGYTGKGVVIADLDSGFQTQHPDLKGRFNLDRAFNTRTGDKKLSESGNQLRHGSGVAGQAGAAADGNGLVGVAHGAELWPIEVGPNLALEPDPLIDPLQWAKAIRQVIRYMRTDLRRVVLIIEGQTACNGNITQMHMIREAILYAIAHGAVVCVAAGNGSREVSEADCFPEPCQGPTFKPAGLIVGATDFDNLPYKGFAPREGTNFGEAVAVSAPGDRNRDLTCTADLDSPYTSTFGATSGAAAKVAGAVALMLEANSELKHADVEQIFRKTGTPITAKPLGRLLNCEEAVLAAKEYPVTQWRVRSAAAEPAVQV